MNLDRAWFQKNPDANFRLRRPGDGEVEDLAKRMKNGVGYELAMAGGKFPPPAPEVEWQIMVIKAGSDSLIRLLTLRTIGAEPLPAPQTACYAIAIGDRVAVDHRSA